MSQFSCDVCSFESFDSYNATLWAIQNPWFQEYSSLAGALGGQKSQLRSPHRTGDQELTGRPDHPASEAGFQEIGPESAPEAGTSRDVLGGGYDNDGHDHGNHHKYGDSESDSDNGSDFGMVINLGREMPIFCRIGNCQYWHIDTKQVKRHRNTHFRSRYGFLCPNRTDTCPSVGGDFRRSDGVNEHCKRSPECGAVLEAEGGEIGYWGTPATEEDLVPYDPEFHKPYRGFFGWAGPR